MFASLLSCERRGHHLGRVPPAMMAQLALPADGNKIQAGLKFFLIDG